MELLDKILLKKEQVLTSTGEKLKVDSIMIDDNGCVTEHFFVTDSLHELRSLSKVFVALAFGVAIDKKMEVDGKPLSLDTPIYPTIKNLVEIRTEGNLEKIKKWTVKTMLTYSAGFEKGMFFEKYIKDIPDDKLLDYCLNFPIRNEPNEKYVYDNVEFFILSVFFQEAFKINLSEFVNNEIFVPLKINDFRWDNFGKYCQGGTGLFLSHHNLF